MSNESFFDASFGRTSLRGARRTTPIQPSTARGPTMTVTVPLGKRYSDRLAKMAAERGLAPHVLARDLLKAIVDDDLCVAVLGTGPRIVSDMVPREPAE